MWYCHAIRENEYWIGYADGPRQNNGLGFIRKDKKLELLFLNQAGILK